MIQIRACFRHHTLFTLIGLVALAQNAFADDPTEFDRPLPLTLAAWEGERDELNLHEAHAISLELFPQGRLAAKPPFIDWSKWELGGFVGAVSFSSDFEADVDFLAGVNSRVPVPGLGAFGIYAQVVFSHIERDLPFFYDNPDGTWFGIGVGVDYTLWRGSLGYIRPQVGIFYAHWGDINSLDSGIGITVGVQFGLFWIKNNDQTSFTFMPQFQFDGGDHMIFIPLGFSIDF